MPNWDAWVPPNRPVWLGHLQLCFRRLTTAEALPERERRSVCLKTALKLVPPVYVAAGVLWMCALATAQELEPRSYSPAPVGTNFVVINYGRTTGSVVLDPTV